MKNANRNREAVVNDEVLQLQAETMVDFERIERALKDRKVYKSTVSFNKFLWSFKTTKAISTVYTIH